LALVKTGKTTANRVSDITGIKRSTTYDNLNLLINKGIVSKYTTDNVQFFEAADPLKLVHLLEEKKNKIEKIMPELIRLKETDVEKSGVNFYEGKKGVLTVLNDILDDNNDELWFYGSRKMALIALKHYPDNFLKKRADQNMRLKAVFAIEDKGDQAFEDEKVDALSEFRHIKGFNGILANVFIYGDKVAFMSSQDNPIGIIIRNKEIVEQQKKLFEVFWNMAK
jgi:sugar-specific transcriptional regulator TrmB